MKKQIILSALASIVMLSCSNSEKEDFREPANNNQITFKAKISGPTRATDTEFELGDKISVFATEGESIGTNNYAQNVQYTYNYGYFTTYGQLSYRTEDSQLNFYAIYPYDSYTTPNFTHEVNLDQSTHESYTTSDLMTATAIGKNQQIVDLIFNHRLSKIIINITSDDMPVGNQSLIFKDVYYTTDIDLASNTFDHSGYTSDIKACQNGTNSFKAILPPQIINKGDKFLEITIGNNTYTVEAERDMIFNSGVEYSYTFELKDNNIVFASLINPWGTPEEIESVIPEEYIDLIDDYITIYEGTTPPNIEGTYLISPSTLFYDSGGWESGHIFADAYRKFYNQTEDNTISSVETQLLGDMEVSEGLFISGEDNNFTIYFNSYTTYEDGSWLVKATVISGTKNGDTIENFSEAFIILDDYDTVNKYMDTGEYRVIIDGDYASYQTEWPLDNELLQNTRSNSNKLSKHASK